MRRQHLLMRNFIILFEQKEGTTALVRLLDNFDKVSIIYPEGNSAFEPFSKLCGGEMPVGNFEKCINLLFGTRPVDFDALNSIYTQTGPRPLVKNTDGAESIGFKMRLRPTHFRFEKLLSFSGSLLRRYKQYEVARFENKFSELARKHQIVVLVAIRQDVLRWGLSKYHGDGKGGQGHLQFKVASGQLSTDDIGKIHVDLPRLGKIIDSCEGIIRRRRSVLNNLRSAGISAYPVFYEEFVKDKQAYFKQFFQYLEYDITDAEIDAAMDKGTSFKKVHSDDISTFVENHEQVMAEFGDRFFHWKDDPA